MKTGNLRQIKALDVTTANKQEPPSSGARPAAVLETKSGAFQASIINPSLRFFVMSMLTWNQSIRCAITEVFVSI